MSTLGMAVAEVWTQHCPEPGAETETGAEQGFAWSQWGDLFRQRVFAGNLRDSSLPESPDLLGLLFQISRGLGEPGDDPGPVLGLDSWVCLSLSGRAT